MRRLWFGVQDFDVFGCKHIEDLLQNQIAWLQEHH